MGFKDRRFQISFENFAGRGKSSTLWSPGSPWMHLKWLFHLPFLIPLHTTQQSSQANATGLEWWFLSNKEIILGNSLLLGDVAAKCIQMKPFTFVLQLMRWGDNYTVFLDYGMKHNFTSMPPPFPPPSLQLTSPNEAPGQDQINLLLTEYKLNCINFPTVLEWSRLMGMSS